ncbi:MAG: helix-turn-helix transcriptional regulator [Rikenellaceae bacterium]
MRNILDNIKEIRMLKGITQEDIAYVLNVDTSVISNIEKGKREIRVSELEKIATALDEDVLYLITYPSIYVNSATITKPTVNDERVSVTFEVPASQRQQIINLLIGKEGKQE